MAEQGDRQWLLRRPYRQQADSKQIHFPRPEPAWRCRDHREEDSEREKDARQAQPLYAEARGCRPGKRDPGQDERDQRESREELRLRPIDGAQPSPHAKVCRRRQHAGDVGAEGLDLIRPAAEAVGPLPLEIPVGHGRERQCGDGPGDEDLPEIGPSAPRDHEPDQPQADEDGKIEQEVAVGERLQPPGHREQHGPSPLPSPQKEVKTEQREWNPIRGQHLHVRELRHAVRREGVRDSRDQADVVTARQLVAERVRGQRAEWERQEERDVVSEQRVARRPDDRGREHRQTEQVLRKRRGPLNRVELRQMPPFFRERKDPCVPRQEERIEQRITEIVRNNTAGVEHQRPGEGDCQEKVEAGCQAETHDRSTHQDIAL